MMKNRIVAAILVVLMIFGISAVAVTSVFSAEDEMNIESVEDFKEFSRLCTLDSKSVGLTVNLLCDIDFSKTEFSSVPTFGGTFNGNGYTISGIRYDGKGSYAGVFRYIQDGGKVSDLNVKGEFLPGGSKSFVGGIVGENLGLVEGCSFDGVIKSENATGGIAGVNTDSGRILDCETYGNISGENSTGGIAGKNSGYVGKCVNNASVNTVYEEKEKTMSDIDADAESIVEDYVDNDEKKEEESVLGHTDTGGIVGYSSGIIQGCDNCGPVGYKHVGYNVGGISGRQTGYMLGCRNYAFVQGRKDVGGIVGQAEPYMLLDSSDDSLKRLRNEIDTLNALINDFVDDANGVGDDAKKHLDGMSEYVKSARDSAEDLVDCGSDFIDDNIGEINAQAAILSNTVDKLGPVFESLENSAEDMEKSIDKITDALENSNFYAPDIKNQTDDIVSGLKKISKAENSIKEARKRMRQAEDDLSDALVIGNAEDMNAAVKDMISAGEEVLSALGEIKDAVEDIKNVIGSSQNDFENIGLNVKQVYEDLIVIKDNLGVLVKSTETIVASLRDVSSNVKINVSEIVTAAKNVKSAAEYMVDAMVYITKGIGDVGDGIKGVSNVLSDYSDEMTEEFEKVKEKVTDGMKLLSYAADDIGNAFGDMKDICDELSKEDKLEFVKLGDDFKNSGDSLFDSLSGISGEIDGLRGIVSRGREEISGDLNSVSDKLNVIMNLLVGEVEDLENGVRGISDIIVDVSDEEIEGTKQGKVEECENFGEVEADRNTGGIVGAVAIEYSKDPEDDIEKPETLNFTYRSRAIIQDCVNEGSVKGKKDCAGGIAGKEEIGTVYGCENYGKAESGGDYVGGIVGKSQSSVRKSWSKSECIGKRYVGGIAGKGKSVTQCYAIVSVDGDENTGAVLGIAESDDNIFNNFFVDNGVGAVDGISYENKAEPVEFEKLAVMSNIPQKFVSFNVKFTAEGNVVSVCEMKYGESTDRIEYPDIPEKDGHFGRWTKPDAETVTGDMEIECEYKPYIKLVSSTEKNESGKLALALAEGEFTDRAELKITESSENPPESAGTFAKVYDITLTDEKVGPSDTTTFRLLNEDKDKVSAWALNNGRWEKAEVHNRGKYAVIRDVNASSTICLRYENRGMNLIAIALSILVSGSLIGLSFKFGIIQKLIKRCKQQ